MKNKVLVKVGIVLISLACVAWLTVVIIPFLPWSLALKGGAIAGVLVAGEILFWLGTLCVGKELLAKYKAYLTRKRQGNKKGK